VNGPTRDDRLTRLLPAVLPAVAAALPSFLPSQRWYGAKERAVQRVEMRDTAQISEHPDTLLAVVDVYSGADAPTGYFLPLGAWPAADASAPGDLIVQADDLAVRDAIADPDTCRALLRGIAEGRSLPSAGGGRFVFRTVKAQAGGPSPLLPEDISGLAVRHANVEQSNSSVIFGNALILKALRRLVTGVHPEIEIARFLGERTTFDRLPAMLGWAEYLGPDGSVAPVAVLQRFVANQGDGWTYLLAQLSALGPQASREESLLNELAALGRTLGELHLALGSVSDEPAFAPEVITADDLAVWQARTRASLDTAVRSINAVLTDDAGTRGWSPESQRLGQRVVAGADRLSAAIDGIAGLADGRVVKIRHHGDFHLGQTLVVADGWMLIDFEGEPARTLAERRAKQTPLRDVAGLLRSLDYARATVARQGTAGVDPAIFDRMRERFLTAYVQTVRAATVPILPADPHDLDAAMLALETEKALYELSYELGNRPDWVAIPLTALARLAQGTSGT
jgi:trehalose synthase-fused probable maltokinase